MVISNRYNRLLMSYKVINYMNSINKSLKLFCITLEITKNKEESN